MVLPLPFYHYILTINSPSFTHTPRQKVTLLCNQDFWLEIPLKLENQMIQIKALVCDSECPYDIVLGRTSMAQLSADYASHKLYVQQISMPLKVKNNIHILPGQTGIISLALQSNKSSFTPRHTITWQRYRMYKTITQHITFKTNRDRIQKQLLLCQSPQQFRQYSRIYIWPGDSLFQCKV